ncbi:MAG: MotA/TolQ/ExbB proton channel family protein [Planctomycetota bacterium]|nr:MotA/TolQ/ExbB proton channel family protein [Planctomycetota bacterium]
MWCVLLTLIFCSLTTVSPAQDSEPGDPPGISRPVPAGEPAEAPRKGLSLLALLFKGGWFMVPLIALSVLIVVITVERFLSLRPDKTLPAELVQSLGSLSNQGDGFDPRNAYRICQAHPSVASTVVQSMLLKVGRPITEVESAIQDACQREADRLQRPIRWLELSAAIAPLIGLLGTVWGVTQAFYEMTQLTVGQNKAEALASGIYTALITTICGLMIAIPALVMFKTLESQIEKIFHRIDEMMLNLVPQVERFEGQIRFADPSHATTSPAGESTGVSGKPKPAAGKESGIKLSTPARS